MSLGYGILGFLNYEPMSGYDLAKAFHSSLEFFWHAQNSQIYLELRKLEKLGYIAGETVVQSDRPNKRLFSITKAGKNAFFQWLSQPPGKENVQVRSALLMKVFFSGERPPSEAAVMFRQFQRECEEFLRQMGSVPGSIKSYGEGLDPYQTLYWQFTADFGFAYLQLCVDWAERCAETLEGMEEKS